MPTQRPNESSIRDLITRFQRKNEAFHLLVVDSIIIESRAAQLHRAATQTVSLRQQLIDTFEEHGHIMPSDSDAWLLEQSYDQALIRTSASTVEAARLMQHWYTLLPKESTPADLWSLIKNA